MVAHFGWAAHRWPAGIWAFLLLGVLSVAARGHMCDVLKVFHFAHCLLHLA
jgi:hypothetical protein